MAEKDNLGGCSPETLWQATGEIPRFPRLSGDIRTDVLVIGGGMAGLLTALCLKQRGIDAVVVEQARICSGTTAGTTAKITAQHGFLYSKLLKQWDEGFAQMYYRANARGVENLKNLCRQAEVPLEIKNNYVFSPDPRKLEREHTALQKLGIPVLYARELPIPVPAAGAVGFGNQGQFHPLALGAWLAKNLTIYENTKVLDLEDTCALTDSGRIRAEKVVVATHFPFLDGRGSYFLKLYQHRSYLIALENGGKLRDMYVDESKTGLSFSSFGNHLLLGGGGHRTGKQGESYESLRAFRRNCFPQAREVFRWGAQDTMSLDGVPYIGHYSRNTPNVYVAAGFNKWGMTGSMVSGELLSSLIAGQTPEYAPVFSPSRSILRPQLLVNGFESVTNLLNPKPRRCPHLGCALKYNPQEHSWDCSCHGSRFSESGEVLNNPANRDLRNP